MPTSTLCAVQPIFNAYLELTAQEIFFRDDESNETHILDGDRATRSVLLSAYASVRLDATDSGIPTFVNVTRNLLLSDHLPESVGGKLIYKYSASFGFDSEVVSKINELTEEGFLFALCGVDDWTQYSHLLSLFSCLKVDVQSMTETELRKTVAYLKSKKSLLYAEKIETHKELELCKILGFSGFQGYFLTKPKIVKGRTLDAHTKVVLQLIQELQNPETSPDRIEQLMIQDTGISFKLLRILSSPVFALPRKIDSVKDAVIFLGLDHIRSWATMISMSGLNVKSDLFVPMQLIRAKMCELLAQVNNLEQPRKFFVAGLFSLLDAMLDMEMAVVLENIPLNEEITSALLDGSGEVGDILTTVIAYEKADWGSLETQKMADYAFRDIYLESVQWANQIASKLNT